MRQGPSGQKCLGRSRTSSSATTPTGSVLPKRRLVGLGTPWVPAQPKMLYVALGVDVGERPGVDGPRPARFVDQSNVGPGKQGPHRARPGTDKAGNGPQITSGPSGTQRLWISVDDGYHRGVSRPVGEEAHQGLISQWQITGEDDGGPDVSPLAEGSRSCTEGYERPRAPGVFEHRFQSRVTGTHLHDRCGHTAQHPGDPHGGRPPLDHQRSLVETHAPAGAPGEEYPRHAAGDPMAVVTIELARVVSMPRGHFLVLARTRPWWASMSPRVATQAAAPTQSQTRATSTMKPRPGSALPRV
jgi:hypothetical protein